MVDFPVHKLKLDAVYTSDIPFFDFDSQMDSWTVAREAEDSYLYINGLRDIHAKFTQLMRYALKILIVN